MFMMMPMGGGSGCSCHQQDPCRYPKRKLRYVARKLKKTKRYVRKVAKIAFKRPATIDPATGIVIPGKSKNWKQYVENKLKGGNDPGSMYSTPASSQSSGSVYSSGSSSTDSVPVSSLDSNGNPLKRFRTQDVDMSEEF